MKANLLKGGKLLLVVFELLDAGPHVRGGCAQHAKYLEQLIDLAVAGKEGLIRHHLREDCPQRPYVHWR